MSASGGGVCGIFVFLNGSAPPAAHGFGRRAFLYRKSVRCLRALLQIANRTSGTWRQPRAVCGRAAETCADKSAASGGVSGAHWAQGRARLNRELFLCLRAHFQIQTDVQLELRDQKSVWAKHGVSAFGCFT